MSVFVGNYLESFENMLSEDYPNTYWSMFRLEDRLGYIIRLGFLVRNNMRMCQIEIDRQHLVEKGIGCVYPFVSKLLSAKETVRICTKFWTGVDIT